MWTNSVIYTTVWGKNWTQKDTVLLRLRSPARSLGFTILGEIFVYVTIFNPTIDVVTFSFRGWCMLGVLFYANIHLSRTWMSGSFDSVQWNACVHRLDLYLYSHLKEFWGNGVRTHVNSNGKSPLLEKILPREGSNPQCCIQQDSEPNTLPMSYSNRWALFKQCLSTSPSHTCIHYNAMLILCMFYYYT